MGLTMMGGTYALRLADLYRREGRPSLASALLRHAMSLINPTIQSAEYARAKQQMAALAEVGEETMTATQEAHPTDGDLQMFSFDVLQPEPEVIR